MSEYTQAAPEQAPVVYVEKPRNGLAVAAMVLGIIAVVLVWIPFLNTISLVLAIIAIALAIPGLIKANRVAKGKGQAIAGLVLAIVSGVGFFIVNAATVSAIDSTVTEINDVLDATDEIDVTFGEASYDGFTTSVAVTVVNTSDEARSFIISVNASSPDGTTVYDSTTIATPTLAPGQTYQDEALFLDELPADAILSVSDAI